MPPLTGLEARRLLNCCRAVVVIQWQKTKSNIAVKTQRLALILFIIGFLATSYLFWAHQRIPNVVFAKMKPWPYPDEWLLQWERQLDAAHPTPPGTIKIEGEIPRMEMYLNGGTYFFGTLTLSCFVWILISSRRREFSDSPAPKS
jgi:hypothetical protein